MNQRQWDDYIHVDDDVETREVPNVDELWKKFCSDTRLFHKFRIRRKKMKKSLFCRPLRTRAPR